MISRRNTWYLVEIPRFAEQEYKHNYKWCFSKVNMAKIMNDGEGEEGQREELIDICW